jgi:CheY-like chemotaxis protein
MKIRLARILVVDDDAVMRIYVVNALRRLGVQTIETATDGASALKQLELFQPDVVLTDIHMKPVNGLEFVQAIRNHPNIAQRKTGVIFMSADASSSTLQNALSLESFGYIVKPPRPETLRAKLEMALN